MSFRITIAILIVVASVATSATRALGQTAAGEAILDSSVSGTGLAELGDATEEPQSPLENLQDPLAEDSPAGPGSYDSDTSGGAELSNQAAEAIPATTQEVEQRFRTAVRKAVADYIQMSRETTLRCASVLSFALLIVGGSVFLAWHGVFNQLVTFKLVALTLVVSSGLVLIVAGYSSDQITSMMGLLGTIAGYVLGKGEDAAVQVAAAPTPVAAPVVPPAPIVPPAA
jgi:hypothetical protein